MFKKNTKGIGPVVVILILTVIVIALSSVCSILEFQGEKTEIINGTLTTSLVSVQNIFTPSGFKYILTSVVTNFKLFNPLFLLIISLIGIGIGERSGLFKALFTPLKKLKSPVITFIVFFLGVVSSVIGEYSFVILIPLAGILYKYTNRNSMVGVITAFLGICIGYGTGILVNANDYDLSVLTLDAVKASFKLSNKYNMWSNLYIMLFSTLLISLVGTVVIEKYVAVNFKRTFYDDDELIVDRRANTITLITFLVLLLVVILGIIPIKPLGFLLDNSGVNYVSKLFSSSSPFYAGFLYIFILIMLICGYVYGDISKNVKNTTEYSVGISSSFENLGYVFILMFFTSQLIGILEWTNLDVVIATNLSNLLGLIEFSGVPLIVTFFLIIVIMTFVMPSAISKWSICAPTIVPLFMKSNIVPSFTQFIFTAADGVGKAITPIFGYFIVFLGYLEKYNENKKITIFGTIKSIIVPILLLVVTWILILVGWYVIGLPLGIGTSLTL